jgi:hypothetical protein
VLFYAVRERTDRERFCLAVATSTDPLGPFHDVRHGPLHCDADPNGSLDPAPVVDPATGQPHLDLEERGGPGQRPDPDLVPAARRRRHVLRARLPALAAPPDQPGVGGQRHREPVAHRTTRGRWLLFYSGNEWTTADYATGVAFCDGPRGPCHKSPHNPVLRSHGSILGPGGADAFAGDDGILRLAYHHWTHPHVGYPSDPGATAPTRRPVPGCAPARASAGCGPPS